VAVLTMTLGNVGALLQKNVKRMLAYSSIAQSGYLIVGLLAGPKAGLDSVLFYLLGYGVMNTAVLAVIAALERNGEEVETLDDISGLRVRQPVLAWMLAAGAVGLIGMPPLVGFFGKLYLFSAAIEAGQTAIVIVAAVNSAISAFYYLQLVAVPMLGQPNARTESVQAVPSAWPRHAAVLCGVGVLLLPMALQPLVAAAGSAIAARPDAETGVRTADESEAKPAEVVAEIASATEDARLK
ncbi:MAG: NADH-quinone oxidoreductase subunit N, partial [Planctomycetota bacterium]